MEENEPGGCEELTEEGEKGGIGRCDFDGIKRGREGEKAH